MARGKFVTFEGGEGVGKSTQAALLRDRLQAAGDEVVVTREPGGAPFAERIRSLILSERPADPMTEFLLFAAARVEHIKVTILPALTRGAWVVCDRFIDSTRVYQGKLNAIDPRVIDPVERYTVPTWPDLTVILDLPAEIGRQRAHARGGINRFDAGALADHEQIREGFLAIAKAEPKRCLVIDARQPADAIAAEIWQAVQVRLGP